jgi:hypothetical protein
MDFGGMLLNVTGIHGKATETSVFSVNPCEFL